MKEIVLAGYGGQGVLTIGLIISEVAVKRGFNATWIPSYGSAMRGGTANCTVKYGDDTIYNPSQEEPNVLLAMNEPCCRMFEKKVAENGTIIINSDAVSKDCIKRKDLNIVEIPAGSLAAESGSQRSLNIIMTGVVMRCLGDFKLEQAVESMNDMFKKKGKSKFQEQNTKAFEIGFNYK